MILSATKFYWILFYFLKFNVECCTHIIKTIKKLYIYMYVCIYILHLSTLIISFGEKLEAIIISKIGDKLIEKKIGL